MAYFNNNYYETEFGEYNQTCSSDGNYSLPQDYEPTIFNLFDYDPTPFSHSYNNSSATAYYSTVTPTQPQTVLQYNYQEPKYCQMVTTFSNTFYNQTVTSNSDAEFNAPGFEEYDSTPYGGGYDIVQTYGEPLPPSDGTCFPRDGSKPPEPKKNVDKPPQKPQPEKKEEEEKPRIVENTEAEKEVISQIPSGYGLEAMDLCGSLFGYWPCMTKYYSKRGNGGGFCHCHHQNECRLNGWCYWNQRAAGAADYLFGSSDPYVERRDGGGNFGQPIHCYERHYPGQPLIVQVDDYRRCDDDDQEVNSWAQSFSIF